MRACRTIKLASNEMYELVVCPWREDSGWVKSVKGDGGVREMRTPERGRLRLHLHVFLGVFAGDESIHTAAPPTGATRVLGHFGVWRWF